MYVDYDRYVLQQNRIKALEDKVKGFESGEMYTKMEKGQRRQRAYYERQIRKCKKDLAASREREKRSRDMWFQVFQDVQDECRKELARKDRQLEEMSEKLSKSEAKIKKLQEKVREKNGEAIQARAETQEEKEKNQKLQAQVSRNFRNSSQPSSKDSFRSKVVNNREKTGKKTGAQPGHPGHRRKRHEINGGSVFIPAPPEIEKGPDYYRVNGEVHKQVVSVKLMATVTDYWSYCYRDRKTGTKYHPPFPENIQLDVNYDKSVKALIFLMKNHLNVTEAKISEFLSEMTGGGIQVSRGMINNINREFSEKSEKEREEIFSGLVVSDVLYSDMTGARMNGDLKNIVVCTDGTDILYFFRDTKGDDAITGTPVEFFTNVLLHDHDKTFYHYGSAHQECNEHHLRYLKGASEMEPNLTWHKKMRSLLQEMNLTREKQGRKSDQKQIDDFENRYNEIVELADKEYYDNPPSRYYRKGFNLSKEFREYKESVLHFLRDPKADFTNNASERGCRKAKRHLAVSGTFRGNTNHSGIEYCDAMGVLQTYRARGEDIYKIVTEIFQRAKP
ncbi:MAG: transposase [Clostridiales bacterium]|nr:transposase [Clostridiales bacterium]